ncbi:MAG: hypothetical protein ABSE73_26205, partial [Planctomycetota bacterium]
MKLLDNWQEPLTKALTKLGFNPVRRWTKGRWIMATISFRHPLALTPQGYGKPVCRRLDRYPLSIQGKIQEDLKTLLAAQPRLRSEAPEGLHEAALDFWFAPLGIKSKEARTAFGF